MAWAEADDDRIREFVKTIDYGKLPSCPKCGLGAGGQGEWILALTGCKHKYCPTREWRDAKKAAETSP